MPVTMPALGASPLCISHAASGESSTNAVCGSSSRDTRSRTGSFLRATCFAIASAPPPSMTVVVRSRNCSSRPLKYSRFAANSEDVTSTRLSMTAMRSRILARKGPGLHRANDRLEMAKIFECVPNISEGRRADVIDAARLAAADGKDVAVVDVSSDASHNRSVITLVGTADGVVDAAIRLAGVAVERIDLRTHTGEHPRMGAIDVIPFIPVGESTMDEAVLLARRCAQSLWERFRLPSYFYAAAATRPERRKLADVRKGEFEGLLKSVSEPERRPDVG